MKSFLLLANPFFCESKRGGSIVFKLLIVFFLSFIIHSSSFAQVFPSSNVSWQGVTYGLAGPIPFRYAVCGDTVIHEKTYYKLYEFAEDTTGALVQDYRLGIRVAGERVWCLEPGAEQELLLYDFSLEAGDQITLKLIGLPGEVTIKVAEVTTVTINGESRRVLNFVPIGGIEESWIEGIGSTRGPVLRGFAALDATPYLQCYREKGVLTYRTVPEADCDFVYECNFVPTSHKFENATAGFALFPTLARDQLSFVNDSKQPVNIEVYQLSGNRLMHFQRLDSGQHQLDVKELSPGLYLFAVKEPQKNLYLQHFRIIISE